MWRASAALRCAGLRSATAALGSNCSSVPSGKEPQESIGKSAGEWHFTLRESQAVETNELSPKEATRMSHDVKWHLLILWNSNTLSESVQGNGHISPADRRSHWR